jgi:hypothetical protein
MEIAWSRLVGGLETGTLFFELNPWTGTSAAKNEFSKRAKFIGRPRGRLLASGLFRPHEDPFPLRC